MRDIRNNNNYNNLMETGTGVSAQKQMQLAHATLVSGPGVPEIDELVR